MNISRYVNNVKINEKDLTKYYLDSEIVNKAIYAVNGRTRKNEKPEIKEEQVSQTA